MKRKTKNLCFITLSGVLRGSQGFSGDLKGSLEHSEALRVSQGLSGALRGSQRISRALLSIQRLSGALKGSLGHSEALKPFQTIFDEYALKSTLTNSHLPDPA